jgi:hypothetical protein
VYAGMTLKKDVRGHAPNTSSGGLVWSDTGILGWVSKKEAAHSGILYRQFSIVSNRALLWRACRALSNRIQNTLRVFFWPPMLLEHMHPYICFTPTPQHTVSLFLYLSQH